MQSHTNEMKEIVISTDKESEKVRHEKVVIMSRWKTSINKVSRKDEMLLRLREALKLLRLESKGVKAILGGVGSEIEEAKVVSKHKKFIGNLRHQSICVDSGTTQTTLGIMQ